MKTNGNSVTILWVFIIIKDMYVAEGGLFNLTRTFDRLPSTSSIFLRSSHVFNHFKARFPCDLSPISGEDRKRRFLVWRNFRDKCG